MDNLTIEYIDEGERMTENNRNFFIQQQEKLDKEKELIKQKEENLAIQYAKSLISLAEQNLKVEKPKIKGTVLDRKRMEKIDSRIVINDMKQLSNYLVEKEEKALCETLLKEKKRNEELKLRAEESLKSKLQSDSCYCSYSEDFIYKDGFVTGATEMQKEIDLKEKRIRELENEINLLKGDFYNRG